MSDTKHCVDCKHFYSDIWTKPICNRYIVDDPVRGVISERRLCDGERSTVNGWLGGCGPRGRYFEPKSAAPLTARKLELMLQQLDVNAAAGLRK